MEVLGSLSYPQTTPERKHFGATEVEVVCRLQRSEPSHRSPCGCEAHMPTAEQAVAKINASRERNMHQVMVATVEPGL